jgi:hypothetical protein
MTDAFLELGHMHADARAEMAEIIGAGSDERAHLWAKLRPTLLLHEEIEEQFVYGPVARDVGQRDPTLSAWQQRHESESAAASELMDRLGRMAPETDPWLGEFNNLVEMLTRHIDTEETEIWPKIRQEWGEDKLEEAGKRVAAAKAAAVAGADMAEAIGSAVERVTDVFGG